MVNQKSSPTAPFSLCAWSFPVRVRILQVFVVASFWWIAEGADNSWPVFTENEFPKDPRSQTCRHLNKAYETWTFSRKAEWKKRASKLRLDILVSCGLRPSPRKTPLKPHIFGKIKHDTYTVEKVHFQSWPGFYVTGNLYRPRGKKGPFPGVLCPHGHWSEGRFTNAGEPKGGVPQRAITFAKLGCVAFTYDMVGFGDSKKQMSHTIASRENELWGLSLMKLQTWNSIRSVDFLGGLPDVDPERIACTGASGGGTQTFILMAIDSRVKAAAPVCMVSAFMQGGCECENAPLLRLDTINPEIAALMAPRPLLLVSATGDWTSKTPQVEYPMVKGIYELFSTEEFDAGKRVANAHFKAPHNYNQNSREAAYNFCLKHLLEKDIKEPYKEPPYEIESRENLSVWHGRKLPENALSRKDLEEYLRREARDRLESYYPENRAELKRFRKVWGSVYKHVIYVKGRGENGPVKAEYAGTLQEGKELPGVCSKLIISKNRQRIPALLYQCGTGWEKRKSENRAALLVDPEADAVELAENLLQAGIPVLVIDPFMCGSLSASPLSKRKRPEKMFTTYNRTKLVERIRDIVCAAEFLENTFSSRICVFGAGRAGPWVTLAAPFLGKQVTVAADHASAPEKTEDWLGENFTPHILALGGLKTAQMLTAPRKAVFVNSTAAPRIVKKVYRICGASNKLTFVPGKASPERLLDLITKD